MYQDFERALDNLCRDALYLADFFLDGSFPDEPELSNEIMDEIRTEAQRLVSTLDALMKLGNRMGFAPCDFAEQCSMINTLRKASQAGKGERT